MKIAIMQPTYLPWSGYFNLIKSVDIFVFLDDVVFSKQSWQQRNRVLTRNGESLLTVPVITKNKAGQKINEVRFVDNNNWRDKHYKLLEQSYGKHKFGDLALGVLKECYQNNTSSLCELNINIIRSFMRNLELSADVFLSSQISVSGKRSEYILNICHFLKATEYLSPVGAKEYIEEDGVFHNSDVFLLYQDFSPIVYEQKNSKEFVSHLSIFDLIANVGFKEARNYI